MPSLRLLHLSAGLLAGCSLIGLPAVAQSYGQAGYAATDDCYRDEYRERYIPGSREQPGRVERWSERVTIPCSRGQSQPLEVIQAGRRWPGSVASTPASAPPRVDNNSCKEGTVLGGILGAGLGGAISRGNGRWIGVPVGAVAGALLGCQIDGG